MSVFAFCYQLTIPNDVERLGKALQYTDPNGATSSQVSLEEISFLSQYDGMATTYYFCSASEPLLFVFNQISDFGSYGMTLTGGSSSCISDLDCAPSNGGGGGGGGGSTAYCYQIDIDTSRTNSNLVDFQYTPYGAQTSTVIAARNWSYSTTNGSLLSLYLCSSSYPAILINNELIFDPSAFDITISTSFSSCTSDAACAPSAPPVNCTLSNWGYGATQGSWVEGEWSPCSLINGSYQRYQTRYVITPASNGGTCLGETIQYEACTPSPSGSTATLTTPTTSSITSTSATVSTTISNNGGSPVTNILFKLFKNSVEVGSKNIADPTGQYSLGISFQFTNLLPNTQYTVTATSTNSAGSATTAAGSFTTASAGGFSTPTISAITQTGSTITSIFTNTGGDVYEKYGIIYKLVNSNGLTVGSPGVVKVETGVFNSEASPATLTSVLTGLTANTQYYVRAYVQAPGGTSYVYSSAVNFTTSAVSLGVNSASLSISSIAFQNSAGNAASYNYITTPTSNLNRSYVSIIRPSESDPEPGAYKITANLQQVNESQSVWTISTKTSASDIGWTLITETPAMSPVVGQYPANWTVFQYGNDPSITIRPGSPGYYKISLRGRYTDDTPFIVEREIVVGLPTEDLDLSGAQPRQNTNVQFQVGSFPLPDVWVPEFISDGLYGITVSQTETTNIPTLTINGPARSFIAKWDPNPANTKISSTLEIIYTTPFKNSSLSNTFTKSFQLTVLAPYPVISFSNPSLFTAPISAGGNVTISVNTAYANSYVISSSIGTGAASSPVTYSNVSPGIYTITATATNDSGQFQQNVPITATLTVQAASPILSQLPQQIVSRNIFLDINTLSYVNLNNSTFSNIEVVNSPANGTLTITNYTIRYIPNQDYTGTDLFSIRVKSTTNTFSNTINVGVMVQAPAFTVGVANAPIVFNSTEVGSSRNIEVPIINPISSVPLKISELSIDQDGEEFSLLVSQNTVPSIQNITVNPGEQYLVKIQVEPSSIGVRTARLKINHN